MIPRYRHPHHHHDEGGLLDVLLDIIEAVLGALAPFALGLLVGFGLWGSGLFHLHS